MNSLKTFVLVAIIAIFSTLTVQSNAETVTRKKTTVITTTESEGETPEEAALPEETKESEMTATFGSTATTGYIGCKTEALIKDTVKELKGDCNAWIKDQKADLKSKFLLSSCTENCSDCQAGLRRCNIVGKIRYTNK